MSSAMPLVATAVRRDLLSALADPDAVSIPAAAARVASTWSGRRRCCGLSPSSARTVAALAFGTALEEISAARAPRATRTARGAGRE
jgi:hypothetical protein